MADPVNLPPVPQRALPKIGGDKPDTKAAREFEAVFLGEMTKMMLESVETEGDFSGGSGETIFRGVLAEKMGTAIADRGGIGLAPAVMTQILKMQGKQG